MQNSPQRQASSAAQPSLGQKLTQLDADRRGRFARLRKRCLEMRHIAQGVSGKTGDDSVADDIRTPALDKLLWIFLRLLMRPELTGERRRAPQIIPGSA